MNIDKKLSEYLGRLGLNLDKESLDRITKFLDIVHTGNNSLNLVGTMKKDQIFIRHFLDCLSIYDYLEGPGKLKNAPLKIIDIGSGAGLPGILIGIINRESEITLLDSRRKITEFLNFAVDKLSLFNIKVVCGRAEQISHISGNREAFDLAVARAVARVSVLCELMVPFIKIGGKAIMFKSRKLQEELEDAENRINALGAEVEWIREVIVPGLDEYRTLLILNKSRKTEYKYPRKYAKIIKMPSVH